MLIECLLSVYAFVCTVYLAGALSGAAAGGSASLSTQACAPTQHVDEHHHPHPPKQAIAEKKQPKSHIPSKELPTKPTPPPPPKPSQPFTDIFGAPIRTKSSPDSSTVKTKDLGHSSQPKSKASSSISSSSGKEGKPSAKDKESYKSKDNHHSKDKDSHPSKESKEPVHLSKDSHPPKELIQPLKEVQPKEPHPPPIKEASQSSKESHHTPKEKHPSKEHHSKEGHKSKDGHHSSKEGKTPKESRPPEPKDCKPAKSIKPDKESSKSSTKRAAPTDSHSSHGNVEKKKKSSPISSESCDKSSSHSKHKSKEVKNKTEKHKNKSHSNPVKKEEEKPKHKSSPASYQPPEPKESLKPKPNSPFKAPSPALKPPSPPPKPPSPPPIVKPPSPIAPQLPSPIVKPPSPDSTSMDSDSDESHKSCYNKAQYSSPLSSISESSLPGNNPLPGLMSDHSILSPLSDEDDSPSIVRKRKLSSGDYDVGDVSQDFKSVENKPMPKLKKKQNSSHHKPSFKPKSSENYHRGNGSINNDIPMDHSPRLDFQNNYVNNIAYRQELMQLQQIIMSSENRQLLQNIVDLIEKTGKYEVTNTTFDFDLCSLDPAIIQKIKLYLRNM